MPGKEKTILLGHGSGGKLSQELFESIFHPNFTNPLLDDVHDGAVFSVESGKLAFSTDTFVVNPLFFPGGNIGDLAVNGTINDIAMCGAVPLYLSVGFILEEGFLIQDLEKIVISMKDAADKAGVSIVTGDTKVVERGKGDGVFINTSGIGKIRPSINISPKNAKPDDVIIINGSIGDHGIAVLLEREGIEFQSEIQSDSAGLNHLISDIFEVTDQVRVLRDPTRGGVATTLNEIAQASKAGIILEEKDLPIRKDVKAACEILGLDPLYIANEGKAMLIVPESEADSVLEKMRQNPLGSESKIIGRITHEHPGRVVLKTAIGGMRIVDVLSGEQLPRIC